MMCPFSLSILTWFGIVSQGMKELVTSVLVGLAVMSNIWCLNVQL